MKKFLNKLQYFIYSIMYAVLTFMSIYGFIMLISEFIKTKDISILIYIGIALFAITMFIVALYNCIKKYLNK